MQTKHFIKLGKFAIDFIAGVFPALAIWMSVLVVAHLLATPYNFVAGTSILVFTVLLAPWSPFSVLPNARSRRARQPLRSRNVR